MCSCDSDPADVYREVTRKARKPHRCGECSATISPGDTYVSAAVVWEGTAESYSFCSACDALKREWFDLAREHRLCEPCWDIGSLHAAIFEWVEEAEETIESRERQARYDRTHGTIAMGMVV